MVLDQMVGSGTTLIECKLLGRNGIGVDINRNCIMLTKDRLNFRYKTLDYDSDEVTIKTYVGDARNLNIIGDESIDLIATHPPYANIIPYSKERLNGDLSNEYSIDGFIEDMTKVARESYRVLRSDGLLFVQSVRCDDPNALLDETHFHVLHPVTLSRLLKWVGFREIVTKDGANFAVLAFR